MFLALVVQQVAKHAFNRVKYAFSEDPELIEARASLDLAIRERNRFRRRKYKLLEDCYKRGINNYIEYYSNVKMDNIFEEIKGNNEEISELQKDKKRDLDEIVKLQKDKKRHLDEDEDEGEDEDADGDDDEDEKRMFRDFARQAP